VRILMDLPELTGVDQELSLSLLLDRVADESPTPDSEWQKAVALNAWIAFANERVRYALEQRGFPIEVARAATSFEGHVVPLRSRRVADALKGMRTSQDFQALAVLFKRVKNIAKELNSDIPLDRAALTEPAERALLDELDRRRPVIEQAAGAADYRKAFTEVAGLRTAVDRFFTEVFVMADDERLRNARLKLMADLRDLILQFADISEIVPKTE
jgi:glycyl-tRNA synthetase beta chain